MNTNIPAVNKEQGNAVALTLLGLSVAILAGVVVLYFIGKSSPKVYITQPHVEEVVPDIDEVIVNAREGWKKYVNEEYEFSFEYPDGWIVATGTLSTGDFAVSVYLAMDTGTTTVYSNKDVATHVSIYPFGIATEGILGTTKTSSVVIQVPQALALDYMLTSGLPYATKVVFDEYPSSWNEAGFVFARIPITEEEIMYLREDTEIQQHEFDPLSGDTIERSGFIDTTIRSLEEEILQSFSFTHEDVSNIKGAKDEDSRFLIESPEYGEIIKSPLSVRGQVFEKWFFEGDLSIRLETVDGEVLTEVPVTPLNKSGEYEYTLFEVSLVFENTTATSGQLLFGRSGSFDLPNDINTNKSIFVVFDNE